jgi:hypothetical protein
VKSNGVFFLLLLLMMFMVFIGHLFSERNGIFGVISGGVYLLCLIILTCITYFQKHKE